MHDGPADESIQAYMQSGRFQHSTKFVTEHALPARIKSVELLDQSGRPASTFRTGAELRVRVDLAVDETVSSAAVGVWFLDLMRQVMCQLTTADRPLRLDPGECSIEFCCSELPLQPGAYTIDASLEDTGEFRDRDLQQECASIYVERGSAARGVFYAPHSWRIAQIEPAGMERLPRIEQG